MATSFERPECAPLHGSPHLDAWYVPISRCNVKPTILLASIFHLAIPLAAQAPPTSDTTQIYVAYRDGVDEPMSNDTMDDAKIEVELTVEKSDGSTVDIKVESVIVAQKTTRRQLAEDIYKRI